jgi:hypothetical protein
LSNTSYSDKKVKEIIEKYLFQVPPETRKTFPAILLEANVKSFSLWSDSFFILDFIDNEEKGRINDLKEKGIFPFPGLIKPENIVGSTAFHLENSRNGLIDHNVVKNLFTFDIGRDSTVILRDHKQQIKTIELGDYTYKIRLAYLIFFGDIINRKNMFDFLESLISYSVKIWRSSV